MFNNIFTTVYILVFSKKKSILNYKPRHKIVFIIVDALKITSRWSFLLQQPKKKRNNKINFANQIRTFITFGDD